jgi:large subunit ribosomal protein L15
MNISDILSKERLASLARGYDLERATRWKPRDPNRLKASGVDTVLATSLYAVIGALALQKGGEVANRVAREKVLKPLGVL